MQTYQLGSGQPELAIVGGIHGDEPCGVRAVTELWESAPDVQVPVKLVIANEPALERDVRYVDRDLNRSFPGDPDASAYESRLAAELEAELEGCRVLALHSTQSYADPFALVDAVDEFDRRVAPRLSIMALVECGALDDGRMFTSLDTIEVECGLQGSAAAARNAIRLAREYLVATGALPGTPVPRDVPLFRIVRELPKPAASTHEVHVANFERVAPGQAYAIADGEELVSETAFYPVLLSPWGYEDQYGYAAERVGEL